MKCESDTDAALLTVLILGGLLCLLLTNIGFYHFGYNKGRTEVLLGGSCSAKAP